MSTRVDWLRSPDLEHLGPKRDGGPTDAVDGASPALVLEPQRPEQIAAALKWASRERLMTVIRGRGTKLTWGRVPSRVDVVVSTARLGTDIEHRHGDLTVTVPAGVSLADLNRQLARQGQWLPLDSAFDGATIGGLIATNDSGPLRHRYGTPRDLLIGITLALTDGTLVKSGGHVVKNVAGYDLAKLVSGSFGTLAAITDATFKLLPIPHTSRTVLADYADAEALARDAAAIASSQLEPSAMDVHVLLGQPGAAASRQLAVRFATSPAATAAQVAEAQRLVTGRSQVLTDGADGAWWSEQVRRPWTLPGTTLRLSWMPASLGQVLRLLEELQRTIAGGVELTGRAGLGAGFLRLDGDSRVIRAAVERLRAAGSIVHHVVVLRYGGNDLKRSLDPWGPPPSAMGALQALKRTFDPAEILNAGRGPV